MVVGEPLNPHLRIETYSFEKAMVVGEPWNPHLRHWELFFLRKQWLWVNLRTLISGRAIFFVEKQMVVGEPPNPHLRRWDRVSNRRQRQIDTSEAWKDWKGLWGAFKQDFLNMNL